MNKDPITLGINTTTRDCSVALLVGEQTFVAEEHSDRGHEGIVLNLMDQVFAQAGVDKTDLELLAFGRGPGAFTGIRVATAMSQGLAFGLGIPVSPVSDLLNIAYQHYHVSGESIIAACVDARMHEVYCAVIEFKDNGHSYLQDEALMNPVNWNYASTAALVAVGNGFEEFPQLIGQVNINTNNSDFSLVPTALAAAQLGRLDFAAGRSVEAIDALPVYLRNEVAWK